MDIAIFSMFQPLAKIEPIPREDPTSLIKLSVEGALEDKQILLGWLVSFDNHTVSLPMEKCKTWRVEIIFFLFQKQATPADFQILAGKLNCVAMIIPTTRHFAGPIYGF